MQATMDKSFLFPILVSTGGYIMKMDMTPIQNDTNETNETNETNATISNKQIQNKFETTVKEKVQTSITEDIKKRVN